MVHSLFYLAIVNNVANNVWQLMMEMIRKKPLMNNKLKQKWFTTHSFMKETKNSVSNSSESNNNESLYQ